MATQPQEQPDDFAAAFASFATGGDGTTPAQDDPAPDADSAGASADAPAADPGAGADSGSAAGDPPAGGDTGGGAAADPEPEGGQPAATEDADAGTDELVRRLASLVKQAPEPEQADPAPQQQQETPVYTADEQSFLADYEKDWADVSRGEALKRRAEYRDLVGFVFQEVAKTFGPALETLEVLSTRTHLDDLRTRVEDYDTVRDNVISWVAEQPAYLQAAYNNVIKSGTAEEVADLVSRYRQATGAAASAPTPVASAAKPAVELSEDAKKAASSLAPVNTKRATIPQDDDTNDFDAAFRRFATQGKT